MYVEQVTLDAVDELLGNHLIESPGLAAFRVGSAAMCLATDQPRYIDHNRRMVGLAEGYRVDNEAIITYFGMHDFVEFLVSGNEEIRASTAAFVQSYYERSDPVSRDLIIRAAGYGLGACRLEAQIAEAWRGPTLEAVDHMDNLQVADRNLLKAAIKKEIPPDTDIIYLEKLLKGSPLFNLDIELLSSIVDQCNVESVLGKALELIDNLHLPNRPPTIQLQPGAMRLKRWPVGDQCAIYSASLPLALI